MKAIIFYYSNSGKTKDVATKIQENLGCDMISIEPEVSYGSYFKAIGRVMDEKKKDVTAKYIAPIVDISDIDIILVGYPIWFHKPPMIVLDYLKKYNLDHKKVVPFSTSGSTNIKSTLNILKEAIGNAELCLPYNKSILFKTNFNKWLEKVKEL